MDEPVPIKLPPEWETLLAVQSCGSQMRFLAPDDPVLRARLFAMLAGNLANRAAAVAAEGNGNRIIRAIGMGPA